jgi:3'-phosphoadenosine 5'-phosphosulfate sulfotransferase (PAPS reductase)/FAD synthetase
MIENIIVSFSGGKTSGRMSKLLLDTHPRDRLRFAFMNTGCEEEETLTFIDRCDREWNMDLVWLEIDVNPIMGKGNGYSVVNYETAARNGEPFEAMIQKYGIPNVSFPPLYT